MSYSSGIKGLNTEGFAPNLGEDTLLDCQDLVISQEAKLESRHGLNVAAMSNFSAYNATSANISIFKIPFSADFATSSGYVQKYVVLTGTDATMAESRSTGNLDTSMVVSSSTFLSTYTKKPLAFTFDQSFYIVTSQGWQEMKIDTLDSGGSAVKKIIDWPPFVDISMETFQDTLDLSTNWLDIDKKVGIRVTYVRNARYNDETPREIESAPSQTFEILHPMAIRTQTTGSTIASTTKDKSRIRLRVGANNFSQTNPIFASYVTSASNDRKYSMRIYRTKQVAIAESLPTEYFQAVPDIELGASTFYQFNKAQLDDTTNRIDFGADFSKWKTGDICKIIDPLSIISGVGSFIYYLGIPSGTTFQLFRTPLYDSTNVQDFLVPPTPNTGPIYIVRLYEANATVNDDGIITLPQLYTNPNQDGAESANANPPIAESVVEYKNYHVAANIREPLRAYITMVSQPFVKNLQFIHTTPAGSGTYTFNSFSADTSVLSNLQGVTANNFGIDSPFFRTYPPVNISSITGSNLTTSTNSDLSITGTRTVSTVLKFDGNAVQTNATMEFSFDGTTITAGLTPKYNRTSPYKRYVDLAQDIPYDTNMEWLQFSGTTTFNGRYYPYSFADASVFDAHGTQSFWRNLTVGGGKGEVEVGFTTSGTASIGTTSATDLILANSNYYEFTGTTFDIAKFQEPGIGFVQRTADRNSRMFSYKLVRALDVNTIRFYGVSNLSVPALLTGPDNYLGFFLEGSNSSAVPLYFSTEPLDRTAVANVQSDAGPEITPVLPKGYYNKPVAVVDTASLVSNGPTSPLYLGSLAKSPAQLLDDCVTELVQNLNEQLSGSLAGRVRFAKTPNVGEFYVEYAGGLEIKARIDGEYHSYEPSIIRSTSEYTTLAEYSKNNIRAVSISRYNAPESFPLQSILAPILVGSDKKKVVALAKNADDCFILKEDGIWRMSISGNSSVANVEQVVQIDTTTYCQAPYSVQEINEEIIFLSQKGFISIAGNSISAIGRNIETEVKAKLQRAIANGLQGQIRSWVNEEKRIYGCTIPDSALSFVTYMFNTYTREWTKFGFPVMDAVTDSQGKTLYAIAAPTRALGFSGTLQDQIDTSTISTTTKYILCEEMHTSGQNRNELDQYDYMYSPASAVELTPTTVMLTDSASTLSPWSKLGGGTVGSDITQSGLAMFVGRPAYYRKNGVLYPCTFVSRTATTATLSFPGGNPPNIAIFSPGDGRGLFAGIPASATFNPTSVGTPDTNKQFSEYMIHVDEAVSGMTMKFKTDSQASFSSTRTFAFNTSAPNRTVYRTYIPLAASRGRWFIRQVNHSVPFERLVMTSQTINVRDTSSPRVQKAQG